MLHGYRKFMIHMKPEDIMQNTYLARDVKKRFETYSNEVKRQKEGRD